MHAADIISANVNDGFKSFSVCGHLYSGHASSMLLMDFMFLLSVSTCVNVDFTHFNNLTQNMNIGPNVQLNIDFEFIKFHYEA